MSTVPAPSESQHPPSKVVCARQADAGLDFLLTGLLAARKAMQVELQHHPGVKPRRIEVRRQLLDSLESYAAGLTARGLSAPPSLRDELALQRSLDRVPT